MRSTLHCGTRKLIPRHLTVYPCITHYRGFDQFHWLKTVKIGGQYQSTFSKVIDLVVYNVSFLT